MGLVLRAGYNQNVLPPFSFRRFFNFLAPPAAFAAAFTRSLRGASPDKLAPAQALQSLRAQNRALQTDTARLQRLTQDVEHWHALQAVFHAVPDAVLLCPHAGPMTGNPAALYFLGIASDEGPFHLPPDVLRYPSGQAVPPGALPWAQAARTQAATDWTPYLWAAGAQDTRAVEIAARPVPDGAVTVVRDVSALRRALEWERQARQTRRVLADTARLLGAAHDVQTLCQITTDAALHLLPPDVRPDAHSLLCTFDGQNSPLVLRAASPPGEHKRPRRHADTLPPSFAFDAQSPLLWKVYLDRRPAAAADIAADPLFQAPRERNLLHSPREPVPVIVSALVLPLLCGAAASGHLLVTSSQFDAFSPDTQDALAALALLSASALARAQGDVVRARQSDQFAALHQAALAALTVSDSSAAAANNPPAADVFAANNALTADAFAAALTQCAAAALGAAVCTLSLADAPPFGTPKPDASPPRAWTAPRADAHTRASKQRAGASRCACARTPALAMRRDAPAAHIGIPNPGLGECAWPAFGGQSGTHSALSVPVQSAGATCGALTVFRHGAAPFSPHDLALAETLAALASLALCDSSLTTPPA